MAAGCKVHPTAIVEDGVELGQDVVIDAYAVIRAGAVVGDGSSVGPHSVVDGSVRLGRRNRVSPFASVGTEPQDLKYDGEPTRVEIGDDNKIREFTTINRGTEGGGGVTRVGNSNILMAYSHVAHDCQVGSSIVLANCATLGGHVAIEDYAVIGGLAGVHQYCRVGTSAMVAAASAVVQDVAPFCIAHGNHADLRGLNVVGLRRRGFTRDEIAALRDAYRVLFRSDLRLEQAVEKLAADYPDSAPIRTILRFVGESQRGIVR